LKYKYINININVAARKLNGNAPIPNETCKPSKPPKPNTFYQKYIII